MSIGSTDPLKKSVRSGEGREEQKVGSNPDSLSQLNYCQSSFQRERKTQIWQLREKIRANQKYLGEFEQSFKYMEEMGKQYAFFRVHGRKEKNK